MPLTLTSKIVLMLDALLENTVGVADVKGNINRVHTQLLASGVGLNQADRVFSETRTIAASGTFDLDLAGVLLDIFGSVITFARIKGIIVLPLVANTNNVVLGNHATAAFVGPFGAATHTLAVKPGGILALIMPDATGWAVTPTTADMLKFTNGGAGTGVTYDLIVIGASA